MRHLTPLIKNILMNNVKARDSDNEIIIEIIRKLGVFLTDAQEEKLRSINFESIRRTRQKIQQQGLYQPSPEVAKQRRLKAMIVQQNAPIASPDRLEYLTDHQPEPIHAVSWLND